jgi:PPM family protein phosphatase
MTARFVWGARTDVGRVREINQDSVHAQEGLFVVADGMGGHRGGEVASAVAIESMIVPVGPTTIDHLVGRVHQANAAIMHRAAGDLELNGMGTTLCAVALLHPTDGVDSQRLGIINVGDSRVYRFADDHLVQVTLDHSLVETLVREGRISAEEAINHPQRNILTRALGIGHDLEVDYWELPIHLGDTYLLCSDGLFNEVSDAQIEATIRRLADPVEICDELVRMANEGGSRDNVSVVVARVESGIDAPTVPVPAVTSVEPITEEIPLSPPADAAPRFAYDGPPGEAPPPMPTMPEPALAQHPVAEPALGEELLAAPTLPGPPLVPVTAELPVAEPPMPDDHVIDPQYQAPAAAPAPAPTAGSAPVIGPDAIADVPPQFTPRSAPARRPWWKFWGG